MKIKKAGRGKRIIILICIMLVLSAITVPTYMYFNEEDTREIEPFYFSSNYHVENERPIYEIFDYYTNQEIVIEINNFIDENTYMKEEIPFTIEVNEELGMENVEIVNWEGTDLKTAYIKVKLPDEEFKNGEFKFEIRVIFDKPYEKEIIANFIAYKTLEESNASMRIVDVQGTYDAILTVYTENRSGLFTVKHPEGISIDNDKISEIGNTYFKFMAEEDTVYKFMIHKEDEMKLYGISQDEKFRLVELEVEEN